MTSVSPSLHQQFESGTALEEPGIAATTLAATARELKLGFFDIDCARAKSKSAVLRAIAKALDFPEHFGGNLDALYDSLTDVLMEQKRGMVVVLRDLHVDDPTLAEHVPAIGDVFRDAIEYARENGRALSFILEPAHDEPPPPPAA